MDTVHVTEALRWILPPRCRFSVQTTATASASDLCPEEVAAVERAVPKRQREFAAGRVAARRALAEIGAKPVAIPSNADRSPAWPDGVVGSISHSDDIAAAAVAWKKDLTSVGFDIEESSRVTNELWNSLFSHEEIAALKSYRSEEEQCRWATVLFSAKEAFFKLQYPLTHEWLDFHAVKITLSHESSEFELEIQSDTVRRGLGVAHLRGRFRCVSQLTVTALALPGTVSS